jgi:hypothetical protein
MATAGVVIVGTCSFYTWTLSSEENWRYSATIAGGISLGTLILRLHLGSSSRYSNGVGALYYERWSKVTALIVTGSFATWLVMTLLEVLLSPDEARAKALIALLAAFHLISAFIVVIGLVAARLASVVGIVSNTSRRRPISAA